METEVRQLQQPSNMHFAMVPLSTGVTLHYAECGERKGQAIIFLQAYTDSWFAFCRVLHLLSPSYHALAPDERGHGDSDKPECCYTVEDFTADVDAKMRALEDPISPEFVREFHRSTIHHPVPEEFLSTALSETLKVPARVWRGYMEGVVLEVDDTARLGEIETPTLILWGERDAILGREEQEWRSGAIPDATLKVYPDTGHAVAFERPEWVVRDLQEFIEGTRPAI
jgi:non-heme chloroperoxidase